jgi:hypothetical protein
MAALSSDSAPTCSVYRAGDGSRVESCGSRPSAPAVPPAPVSPQVYPVRIAWSDNSDNESNFVIERCDEIAIAPKNETIRATCNGAWKAIGAADANSTQYIDNTALRNRTYIYRVKAINSKGSSDHTQEAVITTPAQ